METIIKFKANDGTEFMDKQECADYELLIDRVNSIMNTLPKPPSSREFLNGCGYLQHDKLKLRNAKVSLLVLCQEYTNHRWVQQTMDDETVHPSWVARVLGDYGIRPLERAWYRFQCIDSLYREWGQPYFANNPDKSRKCVRINHAVD